MNQLLSYLLVSGFASIVSVQLRGPDGAVCTRHASRIVMHTVENRRKREPSSGVWDYLRMWDVFGIKKARNPRSLVTVYATEYFTDYECCVGWNRIKDTCQADCNFPCQHGWRVDTNVCECDEGWEGQQCEQVATCSVLTPPENGDLYPSFCTTMPTYGTTCQYFCRNGYSLHPDVGALTCTSSGTWNGDTTTPECRDTTSPRLLSCPGPQSGVLEGTNPTVKISWEVPTALDNEPGQLRIVTTPARIVPPHNFSQDTEVIYTFYDATNNSVECRFQIYIQDELVPVVRSCPDDIAQTTTLADTLVSWDPPVFEELTNDSLIIVPDPAMVSSSTFTIGEHFFTYTATNPDNGKSAICSFRVTLTVIQCTDLSSPQNGALFCDNWGDGKICTLLCNEAFDIPRGQSGESFYLCRNDGVWTPHDNVPDCTAGKNPIRNQLPSELQYYSGDCTDQTTKDDIAVAFLQLVTDIGLCTLSDGCSVDGVEVICRPISTSGKRRRRRSTHTHVITINFNFQVNLSIPPDGVLAEDDWLASEEKLIEIANNFSTVLGTHRESLNASGLQIQVDNTTFWHDDWSYLACDYGYVPNYNSLKCVGCGTGRYHDGDQDDCVNCPVGTYQNQFGQISCIPCPERFTTIREEARNITKCLPMCPQGQYSTTGVEPCSPCPKDTYQPMHGSTQCLPCPNGTRTTNNGAKSVDSCQEPCAAGRFSFRGVQPCQPCTKGRYQPSTGKTSCLPCEPHLTTVTDGSSSINDCKDPCNEIICKNGGTCTFISGNTSCCCLTGFEGERCENNIDDCRSQPCLNNATCVDGVNNYNCTCADGFTGAECAMNVDECESSPCQNNEIRPCSFVCCPRPRIELTLPEDQNYVQVDFRVYIFAVDNALNETTPLMDVASEVTYPVTKYQVSSNKKPSSAGEYLFSPAKFTACSDTCEFSVIVKDKSAPQLLYCPSFDHYLQGDSCRDVNVHDYFSTSEMTSWFRDNVGIKNVQCKQPTVNTIAPGETTSVTCQAKDIVGNPSVDCEITFYCQKQVCPPLKPPEFGAFVCHENQQDHRCALICTEGKFHTRRIEDIIKCDLNSPSPRWTGVNVDHVSCRDKGRHKQDLTVNLTCDADDSEFYREVQKTLSHSKVEHDLCHNGSDIDCNITVFCANDFIQVTTDPVMTTKTTTLFTAGKPTSSSTTKDTNAVATTNALAPTFNTTSTVASVTASTTITASSPQTNSISPKVQINTAALKHSTISFTTAIFSFTKSTSPFTPTTTTATDTSRTRTTHLRLLPTSPLLPKQQVTTITTSTTTISLYPHPTATTTAHTNTATTTVTFATVSSSPKPSSITTKTTFPTGANTTSGSQTGAATPRPTMHTSHRQTTSSPAMYNYHGTTQSPYPGVNTTSASPSSVATPSPTIHTSSRPTTQPPAMRHYHGTSQSPSSITTNPGVSRRHQSTFPVVPVISAVALATAAIICLKKKKKQLAIAATYSDQLEDASCHRSHDITVPCDDSLESFKANKIHENNLSTTNNAFKR
ncbi:uncharacterized protein LOC144886476 [Branchiostoma floridae x Branchiostoma japonicum]